MRSPAPRANPVQRFPCKPPQNPKRLACTPLNENMSLRFREKLHPMWIAPSPGTSGAMESSTLGQATGTRCMDEQHVDS